MNSFTKHMLFMVVNENFLCHFCTVELDQKRKAAK